MSFADNLKKRRDQRELSQQKLADDVGVTQATIAQYELGIKFPNVITAVMIAKRLGTTCEELVADAPAV